MLPPDNRETVQESEQYRTSADARISLSSD